MSTLLAVAATTTAACLSIVAGWQRGGWLSERVLWVAIGVVLVMAAHLLPALCRGASLVVRCAGGALWVACIAAACYGHATFFLMAQAHAGESRAEAVTSPAVVPLAPSGRGLTEIAHDRAGVIAKLAAVEARRCTGDCPAARVQRVTLTARLDALTTEADEARRAQVADDRRTEQADRQAERRDSMRADPVSLRMAALLGVPAARVDLIAGLGFAAVLEGVACLLWMLVIPARTTLLVACVSGRRAGSTADDHPAVTSGHEPVTDAVTPLAVQEETETDVTRLAEAIATGRVRATVSDIRRYLGCSQRRALELRRRVNRCQPEQDIASALN
ncbi:hypothetical protein [Paraburkholderia sp. MM6662-R1]|uniref:hypothetical protein n=1 Tax=Paraburkholderia sp. MM6662-R1 TaxID=2991066 RepID=UPI003D1D23D6